MYLNVISFMNGKTLQFQSKEPYTLAKCKEGVNVVTDESNGQVISFNDYGVVTTASVEIKENREQRRGNKNPGNKNRKPAISVGRATE